MRDPYLERLASTIRRHEDWRLKECLNLIPSENRGSTMMRSMFLTDLGNRYNATDMFYKGTRYLDELQSLTEEIAKKVFKAKFADVRPLSGHIANLAVLTSLAEAGDGVLSVSPDDGGYPGLSHLGLGGLLGLENIYFPFDRELVNIDVDRSIPLIRAKRPALVVFGASYIPFPHPTKVLSRVQRPRFRVYDGSHVLGLIAGGAFQDPLREGCSLLIGSTHKSLPGPQGGIILSNDEEVFSKVSDGIYPGVVDNVHLNRVGALAVALLEMMNFGKTYASAVIKNSLALANGLAERGVKVRGARRGYTESHQVLLGYDSKRTASIATSLERANIIIDIAGRLGTSELTRMGYGPAEMERIADLVATIVKGTKPPAYVAKKVKSLVRDFQEPKFVLTSVPKLLE